MPYPWNLRQGIPVKVSRFLPLEQLGQAAEWRPDAARLAAVTVDENYIAVSQDAAWPSYSPADRVTVMVNEKIRLLRNYQIDAIRALQKAALPCEAKVEAGPGAQEDARSDTGSSECLVIALRLGLGRCSPERLPARRSLRS